MTRSARRSRSSSSSWSGAAATAATTAPTAAATAATAAAAPSAAPEPQAPASSGSVSSGGNGSTFPRKLAEMLGHEPEVVTWSAHGLSFFIGDANALTHELLPKYFRHNKLTSFQRQLNLYGFRRITKGADLGAYFHPQFRKDRPDLVARIRRLPGQGATATAKFLPLYYKDVQNSNGKKRGGSGTKGRGQRSESLASFTSTLSHSSSEGSLAEHEHEHESCDGDEVLRVLGGGSAYTGAAPWEQQQQQQLAAAAAASGAAQQHQQHQHQQSFTPYYASSSAGSSCGGDECYSDVDAAEADGAFAPYPCYTAQGQKGQAACVEGEGEVDGKEEEDCDYTFIDPAPLPVTPHGGADMEVEEAEGPEPELERAQLYAASAPARFQQYWQPSPSPSPSPTASSSAAGTLEAAAPSLEAAPLAVAIPSPTNAGGVRSYTPLPLGAAEGAPAASSSSSGGSTEAVAVAVAAGGDKAGVAAGVAAPLGGKIFSVTSFSQWLNGSCNLATPSGTAAAGSAGCGESTPPPPRPLVKHCSSMNSELWRGWASQDDLAVLADMDPQDMDEIFFSLSRDAESVLHSVGLEIASDGSLRPDASTAPAAAASAVGLSITAA